MLRNGTFKLIDYSRERRGGYGVAHTLLSLRDISPGRGITSAARDKPTICDIYLVCDIPAARYVAFGNAKIVGEGKRSARGGSE